MGLRDKVALTCVAVALLQTCVKCMPRSPRKSPMEHNFHEEFLGNNENFRQPSVYKTLGFSEVEYPFDTSPRLPFYSMYSNSQPMCPKKSKINAKDSTFLNNFKNELRYKRKNNQNQQLITKTYKDAGNNFDDPVFITEIGTFPEMQFPLTASDTWTPSFWNPLPFNNEDPYFTSDVTTYKKQKNPLYSKPSSIIDSKGVSVLDVKKSNENETIKNNIVEDKSAALKMPEEIPTNTTTNSTHKSHKKHSKHKHKKPKPAKALNSSLEKADVELLDPSFDLPALMEEMIPNSKEYPDLLLYDSPADIIPVDYEYQQNNDEEYYTNDYYLTEDDFATPFKIELPPDDEIFEDIIIINNNPEESSIKYISSIDTSYISDNSEMTIDGNQTEVLTDDVTSKNCTNTTDFSINNISRNKTLPESFKNLLVDEDVILDILTDIMLKSLRKKSEKMTALPSDNDITDVRNLSIVNNQETNNDNSQNIIISNTTEVQNNANQINNVEGITNNNKTEVKNVTNQINNIDDHSTSNVTNNVINTNDTSDSNETVYNIPSPSQNISNSNSSDEAHILPSAQNVDDDNKKIINVPLPEELEDTNNTSPTGQTDDTNNDKEELPNDEILKGDDYIEEVRTEKLSPSDGVDAIKTTYTVITWEDEDKNLPIHKETSDDEKMYSSNDDNIDKTIKEVRVTSMLSQENDESEKTDTHKESVNDISTVISNTSDDIPQNNDAAATEGDLKSLNDHTIANDAQPNNDNPSNMIHENEIVNDSQASGNGIDQAPEKDTPNHDSSSGIDEITEKETPLASTDSTSTQNLLADQPIEQNYPIPQLDQHSELANKTLPVTDDSDPSKVDLVIISSNSTSAIITKPEEFISDESSQSQHNLVKNTVDSTDDQQKKLEDSTSSITENDNQESGNPVSELHTNNELSKDTSTKEVPIEELPTETKVEDVNAPTKVEPEKTDIPVEVTHLDDSISNVNAEDNQPPEHEMYDENEIPTNRDPHTPIDDLPFKLNLLDNNDELLVDYTTDTTNINNAEPLFLATDEITNTAPSEILIEDVLESEYPYLENDTLFDSDLILDMVPDNSDTESFPFDSVDNDVLFMPPIDADER